MGRGHTKRDRGHVGGAGRWREAEGKAEKTTKVESQRLESPARQSPVWAWSQQTPPNGVALTAPLLPCRDAIRAYARPERAAAAPVRARLLLRRRGLHDDG